MVLAELTRPQKIQFWGEEYEVTPVLIEEVLGDGKQIIGFAPLNTRPNYYIVRIDSGWCLNNWDTDAKDLFLDHVEEVYEAIEAQCMNVHHCPNECETGECYDQGKECPHGSRDWPALNDECGSGWWLIETVTDAEQAACKAT